MKTYSDDMVICFAQLSDHRADGGVNLKDKGARRCLHRHCTKQVGKTSSTLMFLKFHEMCQRQGMKLMSSIKGVVDPKSKG